ncbi:MAG: hypothetical protein H6672_12735 [Anaerolineaceae bacterium]|nr:hypothetical protein [Anaerolineaceae bacterium]
MASLNTFGAIMTFAIALETQLRDYYQAAGHSDRVSDAEKRRVKMERVRRENVLEITLEAIEGLDEADYALNLADTSTAGQSAAETVASQFYADVAPKINVRVAQRALERCSKEHQSLAEE